MKRAEINAILDNTSIKDLVNSQPGCAWTIRRLLSNELGDTKCPSETAIKTYIKNYCNLVWDEEKDLWISSKEDINSAKKSEKKREKKSSKTLSIHNGIETENNNNSTLETENLLINENSINSNLSEKGNKKYKQNSNLLESKNKEKVTPNNTENKTTNSSKKSREKGIKNSPETFTKTHEIEIDDDDNSIPKDEDLSSSNHSTNSNPSEKINKNTTENNTVLESKNNKKSTSDESNNETNKNINQLLKPEKVNTIEKDIVNTQDHFSSQNSKFNYENIDPSEYSLYIELYGNEKYSLSLSPFVIGKIEEIILKKYKKKSMNKSKLVQLALIEFIRLTNKYSNKDTPY